MPVPSCRHSKSRVENLTMKKTISRSWVLVSFCLVLALALSAVTPQVVAAQEPPSRPDIPHGRPQPAPAPNGGSGDSATGRIVLSTQPGAWTVVQWQDGRGQWHDVEGWRGQASGGTIAWTVEEKDFGSGPFHWVAYQPQAGRIIGASYPFYLPGAGETVRLEIQGGWNRAPAPNRNPRFCCPDRRRTR